MLSVLHAVTGHDLAVAVLDTEARIPRERAIDPVRGSTTRPLRRRAGGQEGHKGQNKKGIHPLILRFPEPLLKLEPAPFALIRRHLQVKFHRPTALAR